LSEEMQKRLITITSTALAAFIASRLADRFVDEPEERGVRDDVKEALLKASFSLVSTIVASYVIRNFVASRWGS
jgi:hypothetical protein